MARASTTSDAFNAIAPAKASKHLRVLREVQLVRVRDVGKQRYYGLDAHGLQPIHQWVGVRGVMEREVRPAQRLRKEIKHEGDQ